MGDNGLFQQRTRLTSTRARSALAILLVAIAGLIAACGGGGGGSSPSPSPQIKTALVVGNPGGPIYEGLASTYHIVQGQGSETSIGFDVLIYDGATVTREQIGTLPTTVNFLSTGKILIVLAPSQADREALEAVTGVAALVDSPALALFDSFSKGLLQAVSMVEFPTAAGEDSMQNAPPGSPASAEGDQTDAAQPDETTLRTQTDQWRKSHEGKWRESKRTFAALSGVAQAQLARAAADTDGSTTASADTDAMDLSSWLNPAQEVPQAP